MISFPTRLLCATLSLVGAAGLVAFASPAVAVGGTTAQAPATIIAAAATTLVRHG